MSEYKIHNADITLRFDATTDDLIDVIEGNRIYIPCIYLLNKIDQISIEELDVIYKIPHCVPISAHHRWNFDDLLDLMWQYLKVRSSENEISFSSPCFTPTFKFILLIISIFSWFASILNPKDNCLTIALLSYYIANEHQLKISVTNCIELLLGNSNSTLIDFGFYFIQHHSVIIYFLFSGLVWGSSVKHQPQKVGIEHILNDEDVVQIVKKV